MSMGSGIFKYGCSEIEFFVLFSAIKLKLGTGIPFLQKNILKF